MGKLNREYKSLIVAVFLAIGALGFGYAFIHKNTGFIQEKGVLGGPSLVSSAEGAEINDEPALSAPSGPFLLAASGGEGQSYEGTPSAMLALAQEGTLKDPGQPVGPAFDRSGETTYTIQSGDNLSEIASYFGISVATIVNANPGVKASTLRAGATLNILPTSGVVYESETGDTLASISTKFDISQGKIAQFNPSVQFASLNPGVPIIIPGGTESAQTASVGNTLPNLDADFIMPAQGYNWGILHNYNAVDIANSCGTPVVAAAQGLVIPDPNIPDVTGGWNGGYGNFVLIEHPFGNNVETRYAHLSKILVQVGDYVQQGQEIGLMGESGEATGCHVHFEVIGAQNPFAKS